MIESMPPAPTSGRSGASRSCSTKPGGRSARSPRSVAVAGGAAGSASRSASAAGSSASPSGESTVTAEDQRPSTGSGARRGGASVVGGAEDDPAGSGTRRSGDGPGSVSTPVTGTDASSASPSSVVPTGRSCSATASWWPLTSSRGSSSGASVASSEAAATPVGRSDPPEPVDPPSGPSDPPDTSDSVVPVGHLEPIGRGRGGLHIVQRLGHRPLAGVVGHPRGRGVGRHLRFGQDDIELDGGLIDRVADQGIGLEQAIRDRLAAALPGERASCSSDARS